MKAPWKFAAPRSNDAEVSVVEVQGISGRPARAPYGGSLSKSHLLRMRVLLWAFLVAFGAIGGRLIWLQVDPGKKLSEESNSHIGQIELRVPRGDIRDCRGSLLATDRQVPSLWADPRFIDNPYTAALQLSARLSLDEDHMSRRLSKRDAKGHLKKFVWVKRWLSDDELARVEELRRRVGPGLALKNEAVRFYPEGELGAHLLGFANREGLGCEGVERAFDKYLRSVPGRQKSRVDAKRNILASLTLEYVEPEGGDTVILTIDKAIQHSLGRELDEALLRTDSPRAMGVVMDPRTGAILALACRPAFDPNRYSDFSPEQYGNRALVDVFEPGSAFKVVTASAALEHGLVALDTLIDCEGGSFNPYGHRIGDYHKMDIEPFSVCYAQSSNIAMIKVAAMLGPARLERWVHRFGFGEKASADFLAESRGIVRPLESWTRYSMGAVPIGQEVSVTILQLARAYSVIANGGYLIRPYVVERATNRDGDTIYQHRAGVPERVLSAATVSTMKELSHQVVLEGTGRPASIPEYRVGGKTGTGQVARPDGKGYYKDKYTAVFAGFAPVADPWVCAVIVLHEPGIREHWGSHCCGPVFQAVVREALIRLGCPEEPVDESAPVREDVDTIAAYLGLTPEDPVDLLDGLELLPRHHAAEGAPVLPCFTGLTMRQVKSKLMTLGLNWDFQGAGRVVLQDPPAQTLLSEVTLCRLVFSNKRLKTEEGWRGNAL